MSFVTGTTLPLIRAFIEDEFESGRSEEGSILRDNTMATKLMKSYLNRVGSHYLVDVLSPFVNEIVVNERKVSMEINPR
jgi:hypothetical protein